MTIAPMKKPSQAWKLKAEGFIQDQQVDAPMATTWKIEDGKWMFYNRRQTSGNLTPMGLSADIKQVFYYPPVPFDPDCVAAVRRAAKHLGLSHRDIVSGAGHDACYLARVAPTSMIFTPCVDGVSHNESEDIKQEWATAGANVLMHAVLEKAEIVA